jgi:hypothetical protein
MTHDLDLARVRRAGEFQNLGEHARMVEGDETVEGRRHEAIYPFDRIKRLPRPMVWPPIFEFFNRRHPRRVRRASRSCALRLSVRVSVCYRNSSVER